MAIAALVIGILILGAVVGFLLHAALVNKAEKIADKRSGLLLYSAPACWRLLLVPVLEVVVTKRLITILLLALSLSAGAQGVHESRTFKVREHVAPAVLVFVSGAFEGAMDHLQFHYDGANQFWQPDISWQNKYRNRDVAQGKTFAGKYLVWTTDGWHMMKFGRNLSMFAGFAIHINKTGVKKRWYVYILEGVSYWAINRAGFTLTYNLLPR